MYRTALYSAHLNVHPVKKKTSLKAIKAHKAEVQESVHLI